MTTDVSDIFDILVSTAIQLLNVRYNDFYATPLAGVVARSHPHLIGITDTMRQ